LRSLLSSRFSIWRVLVVACSSARRFSDSVAARCFSLRLAVRRSISAFALADFSAAVLFISLPISPEAWRAWRRVAVSLCSA